jgi:hypothetical protein
MEKIENEKLLREFMTSFYGYGNLKGEYWFVGMEEGGGDKIEKIISRLSNWENAGKPTLMDNYEFHKGLYEALGLSEQFEKAWSKYQRTWGGLIKILLNFENKTDVTINRVKSFQTEELGRENSNTCIVEVFPLPSPNSKEFRYSKWTNIDFLGTREKYKSHLKKERIDTLRKLITENEPKFVIFYSSNPEYVDYWSAISGTDFTKVENEVIEVDKKKLTAKFHVKGKTCFVITHHPTYNGMTNKYFRAIGNRIRENLNI